MSRPRRIAFLGDVMLGRLVARELRHRKPESLWGNVLPVLRSADAVIANLECAITTSYTPWRRTPKVFHFRADRSAIEVLKVGNIRAVSLANNHVLDFETEGLFQTIDELDRAGIVHAGAGIREAAAHAPAWLDLDGLKLALLAVTDNEPAFAAGFGTPGTAYINLAKPASTLPPTRATIEAARRSGADLMILSCHLGPNMVLRPSKTIRAYHQGALARGVDIVHGNSAHVFQGVEQIGRGLILHDCGDFLDDYMIDRKLHNDWSFIFIIELSSQGLSRLSLIPVVLEFCEVRLADPHEARGICRRMQELSAALGTKLMSQDNQLELSLV